MNQSTINREGVPCMHVHDYLYFLVFEARLVSAIEKMCCWNRKMKKDFAINLGKKLENIAFIATLVIVLGLFTLPIIFYFTSVSWNL